MIKHNELELLIFLAGLAHIGILIAGLLMTKMLRWRQQLKQVDALSQHVIWTHGAYVWVTIFAFTLLSIFAPHELVSDNFLAKAICSFMTLFWGGRCVMQFGFFDVKPHLTTPLLKIGFHLMTVAFAGFTIIYGYTAFFH